jgi:hypothetical protein
VNQRGRILPRPVASRNSKLAGKGLVDRTDASIGAPHQREFDTVLPWLDQTTVRHHVHRPCPAFQRDEVQCIPRMPPLQHLLLEMGIEAGMLSAIAPIPAQQFLHAALKQGGGTRTDTTYPPTRVEHHQGGPGGGDRSLGYGSLERSHHDRAPACLEVK